MSMNREEMLAGIEKCKRDVDEAEAKWKITRRELRDKRLALQLWWGEKKSYKKKEKAQKEAKDNGTNKSD